MGREAVVDASAIGEEEGEETARRCRLSGKKKMEWIRGRGARAAGQRPGSEDMKHNFFFLFFAWRFYFILLF
jgi:hypothetical protein